MIPTRGELLATIAHLQAEIARIKALCAADGTRADAAATLATNETGERARREVRARKEAPPMGVPIVSADGARGSK